MECLSVSIWEHIMKNLAIKLLSATVLAGAVATGAQAQLLFPAGEIHGMGASSVSNVQVNLQNCLGDDNPLGVNNGTTSNVTLSTFTGANPLTCTGSGASNAGNIYNSTNVFSGLYISTGSGLGREEWRLFSDRFDGSANKVWPDPLGTTAFGATHWSNIQYAFSDAAATTSDITAYNTNAAPNAGAAVQFPLYVFPVAFAYNPVYGFKGTTELRFNITKAQKINGLAAGGLKLSTQNYCDIWNGVVTNWNDASLLENQGGHSLRSAADDLTRWNTVGVPIRLIGRADKSGTTDLLTHALKAQCAGKPGNKFTQARESLPYDNTSTINIAAFRSDTNYVPGNNSNNHAGTTQSIGGLVYDRKGAAHGFCDIGLVTASDCSAFAANQQTPGLFILADGSGGVEEAVRADNTVAPNALLTGVAVTGAADVTLNGKFGYISADFVVASPGRTLHSAALQQDPNSVIVAKTKFLMPATKNASTAFGSVLPPQTTAASGKFAGSSDTRTVYKDLTNTGLGTETVSRSNPLHWVNVLYPPSGTTLESPTAGYPVTGPSNLLTYTCFSSAGKRNAINNMVTALLNAGLATATDTQMTLRADGATAVNPATFTGTSGSALGILTKLNVATVPKGWAHAIQQTFFKNSAEAKGVTLGSLNLWIRDDADTANSTCAGKPGA